MISFLYQVKDTTLYKSSRYRLLNTGNDEVLELTNNFNDRSGQALTRVLIQFDINSLIQKKDLYANAEYHLKLNIMESTEVEAQTTVAAYPTSATWDEGKGRFPDPEYPYQGASWKYRDSNLTLWDENSTSTDTLGGGSWYDREELFGVNIGDIECTFEFVDAYSDIEINVTKIVNYWINNEIDNNGFLLKFLDEDKRRSGTLKFFSRNTNTIYYPHLAVSYSDYYFNPCECETVGKIECHPDPTPTPTPNSPLYVSDPCPSGSLLFSGSCLSGSLDSGSLCLASGSFDSGTLVSGSLVSGSLVSGSLVSGSLISDFWDAEFLQSGSFACSSVTGSLVSGSLITGSLESDTCLLVSGTSDRGIWFCPIDSGSLSLYSGSLVSGSLVSGSFSSGSVPVSGSCSTGSLNLTSPSASPAFKFSQETIHGNIKHITDTDVVPFIRNVRAQYRHSTQEKIRVGIRERYPTKTFSSASQYDLNNFVTCPMYFSVRDAETEEVIIEHSKFSRISCDLHGHYFVFDFNCLPVGRVYKFLVLIESTMGSVIHEDERTFIVRS